MFLHLRNMLTFRLFIFVVLMSASCFAASAQNQESTSQKVKLADAFLVERNKPSVYITYEKSGNAEPLYEKEGNERVWARLHNNTKGEISFCFFKVNPMYGDVGLYYDVRRHFPSEGTGEEAPPELKSPNQDTSKQTPTPDNKEVETPSGYSYGDSCVIYSLTSGKSVLFSIPESIWSINRILSTLK